MPTDERFTQLNDFTDFASTAAFLGGMCRKELKRGEIFAIERKLSKLNDNIDAKIAYLTNFTIDFMPAFVNAYCAIEGIRSDSYVCPYNQYFQEILNDNSSLAEYDPDIILFALSMRHLEAHVFNSYSSLEDKEKDALIVKLVDYMDNLVGETQKRFNANILVSNFPIPLYTHDGVADVNTKFGEIEFYYQLNMRLTELFRKNPKVHIFDAAKLSARIGGENAYHPKMYYTAKMIWSEAFISVASEEILRFVIALKGLARKCLVVDLDNTLWGGVVGEDGPMGIKVGLGDPVSEAYHDFQKKIKTLKDKGILLGICSKNNYADVIEAFERRPEMPLEISDFSATQINWDHKHVNLQRLAAELNIGLDSLVFFDDNPAECYLIQQMLPQIRTVLMSQNPEEIPRMIDDLVEFEKIVVLEEDRRKTDQYRQNKKRISMKKETGDLLTYLKSLQTEVNIREPKKEDLNRIQQLFTKTNQFNVTTKRYSIAEIEKFVGGEPWDLKIVSASDRFGELGIIGLYLLEKLESELRIDSFILSCRAMGRGIESAMMNQVKTDYCMDECPRNIVALYEPTKKNKPVKNYFENEGFKVTAKAKKGRKNYNMQYKDATLSDCSWILLGANQNGY